MSRTPLFGIPFDDLSMEEAVAGALRLIDAGGAAYAVTPNPEIVLAARKNAALKEALCGASLILPDGVGLVHASRILGHRLQHRVPGVDFALALTERLAERQGSVFLLGAAPGVAEEAAEKLREGVPGLRIAGTHHGFFSEREEAALLAQIEAACPDLVFVCFGSPKQELWMKKNVERLSGGLMIGLGGALDVISGRLRRAPPVLRKLGLEWLYRLLRQPKRLKRVIRLPGILWAAIREKAGI